MLLRSIRRYQYKATNGKKGLKVEKAKLTFTVAFKVSCSSQLLNRRTIAAFLIRPPISTRK